MDKDRSEAYELWSSKLYELVEEGWYTEKLASTALELWRMLQEKVPELTTPGTFALSGESIMGLSWSLKGCVVEIEFMKDETWEWWIDWDEKGGYTDAEGLTDLYAPPEVVNILTAMHEERSGKG
jgi:hypothetical protein